LYKYRKSRAINVHRFVRNLLPDGKPKPKKSYELELASNWKLGHPKSVLTKFSYSVKKEGSETEENPQGDYYTMSDTRAVYAYTVSDSPKVTDVFEVNIRGFYDRHKPHKKPCCQTRLDMIELGLIPKDRAIS
jgi:hypothetical protein